MSPMPTTERAVDRARRIARSDRLRCGTEIRDARTSAGLSLETTGRAIGLSASQVSRIERGLAEAVTVQQIASLGSVVGLDVRLRTYPGPDPLRDAAQQRVLDRLLPRLAPGCRVTREVTLGIDRDLRAWDARIDGLVDASGNHASLEVEAETRIGDGQAFLRRLARKMRDGGVAAVLVVVADTPTNRAAVDAMHLLDATTFPVTARVALAALGAGRHPGGSSVVFL